MLCSVGPVHGHKDDRVAPDTSAIARITYSAAVNSECPENVFQRPCFGEDVVYAGRFTEQWANDPRVKFGGNVDATVGNPVIVRSRRIQSLQAALLPRAGNHRVKREGAGVTTRETFAVTCGWAVLGDETARGSLVRSWRGIFRNRGPDARRAIVAARDTEKGWSGAHHLTSGVEDQHFGADLIDDDEGPSAVVRSSQSPSWPSGRPPATTIPSPETVRSKAQAGPRWAA